MLFSMPAVNGRQIGARQREVAMNSKTIGIYAASAVLVAFVAAPAATRTPAARDDKGEALLKQVKAAYGKVTSLSADLIMDYEFGGQKQSMKSKVVVKKPNLFRMTMGAPQAGTFVSDGKKTIMYMQAGNQYMKMPKGAEAGAMMGNFGAGLVIDAHALNSLGKIEHAGSEAIDGVLCEVLKGEMEKNEVKLWIQPNFLIRRTSMKMGEGPSAGSMQSTLKNVVTNKVVPAATFVFAPPKGATEMKMPSPADYDAKLVKVGKLAPKFTLAAPTGGTVSLENTLKGKKAVLVNFWFYN
jgi:outer membrane lipoprotein-sorting protein